MFPVPCQIFVMHTENCRECHTGLSALIARCEKSWGDAPGWNGAAPLALNSRLLGRRGSREKHHEFL